MSVSLRVCFLVCSLLASSSGFLNVSGTTPPPSSPQTTPQVVTIKSTLASATATSPPPLLNKAVTNVTENSTAGEAKEQTQLKIAHFLSFLGPKNVIGGQCKTHQDCSIKEAFCTNGTCQCSSEFVASPSKQGCLVKARSLLDSCTDTVQCEAGLNATDLVSCIAFRCICDLDARLVEGKCYKRLGLGHTCQHSAECSIPYSSCIQNVCACGQNMEPDPDNMRCIVMQSIDAASTNCTDDYMCNIFGELYQCKNGNCVCKPGYHFSGQKCVPELRLGEMCERSSDCIIDMEVEKTGLRECKKNICTCIEGYKTDLEVNLCKNGGSLFSSSAFLILSLWLAKMSL